MKMKILDPSRDLNLDQVAWQGITAKLGVYRQAELWDDFARLAVSIKILDSSKNLDLDQKAWQKMKIELNEFEQDNNWERFSSLAMNMKILAAEEVKVTNKGLEINMRKNKDVLASEVPPIPEIKKF
jgi:hypothetical protein